MQRVAFGPSVIESGKKKGQSRTLSFTTGIKLENNTTGLPVDGGKVQLSCSPGDFTVVHFDSADEVRAAAGDQFDTFVVEAANDRAKSAARTAITGNARKLSLAPSNVVEWLVGIVDAITPESLFAVKESKGGAPKGPRGVKAELAALSANAESMSKEDLLAIIAKLAAK